MNVFRMKFLQEIPTATPLEGDGTDTGEIGSKEERRKKNKKIEVTDLFRSYKKQKTQSFLEEDEPNTESLGQPLPAQVKKKDRFMNKGKGKLNKELQKYSKIKQIIGLSCR